MYIKFFVLELIFGVFGVIVVDEFDDLLKFVYKMLVEVNSLNLFRGYF